MSDPRFDPAFQRGYSGPDPEPVPRAAPSDGAAAPRASEAELPSAATPAPSPRVGDPESLPDAPALRRNPYRLALLLVGLALLVAAVSMLYEAVQHPQGTSTTVQSQFLNLLVGNLPPALALSGLVCLIAWLALGALDRAVEPDGPSGRDAS